MHSEGNKHRHETVRLIHTSSSREEGAMAIVTRYVLYSTGAGIIPVPIVDAVLVSAVQLKMIAEISKFYKIEFQDNLGKSVIAALLGGVVGDGVGNGLVKSALSFIPVVGPVLGGVGMAVTSGAVTYALGRVFIHHYEAGGTLLTFNPDQFREQFRDQVKRQLKRGKHIVKKIKTKK